MTLRKKAIKGSLLLSAGEAVIYGSSFVRNMILARVLSKVDFGIAAAFAMIITLLEFSSKLGMSRFIIGDKDGDKGEFLDAAHLVQGLAAVFSALVIAAAAKPIAHVFGLGNQLGALFVLAAVPLLQGLSHLGVKRLERDLKFGPAALVEIVPQVVITLAAWPVAKLFGDYRAVLVLLILKAAGNCVGSQYLSQQPYRWHFHREYVGRMLRFGWPLLVTGMLMFGVLQGDQFIVASFYTLADLGPYAAAAALTMAPSFFFGRVFNSIALPVMARVQDEPAAFERNYRLIVACICVFSASYAVGAITGAEALMQVVYGKKYAGSGIIMAWLAAGNAFRNIRIAPTIAAMARGDSVNQMVSNLARVAALIPALILAISAKPVWMVAGVGLAGEALACSVAFHRLSAYHGVAPRCSIRPTLLVVLAVLLAGLANFLGVRDLHPALSISAATLGAILAGGLVGLALPDSRREAFHYWNLLRDGGWLRSLPFVKRGKMA